MGTAQVFSFVRRRAPRDWSAQDVAEFYRVEAALIKAGLRVSSARGLTDEGDPWFVFCRDDEEIIVHFARIDGRYVISAPAYCGNASGHDFRALVRDTIERHPVLRAKSTDENLLLHPAGLLIMLVATAFLKAGSAAAATPTHGASGAADAAGDAKPRGTAVPTAAPVTVTIDATQQALLLSALSALILAPVSVDTITIMPSAEHPTPDVQDQPLTSLTESMRSDRANDAPVVGSSGVSPTTEAQSVSVRAVEASLNTHSPAAAFGDTLTHGPGKPDAAHMLPPPDAPSFPAVAAPADAAANSAVSAQVVALAGLSNIPHADKVMLQSLGVADAVAYAPVPPATLAIVIHAEAHTTAVNTHGGSASPTDVAAAPTQAAAHVTTTADASELTKAAPSAPVVAVAPGSAAPPVSPALTAAPDISAVMSIVQHFQTAEVQPTVMLSEHGAIFYDAYAVNTQYSAVKSVTYDFGDGFSISLVGLPTELTHAGAHV
jgi:hypothetical protein